MIALLIGMAHAPLLDLALLPVEQHVALVTAYTKDCKGCSGITASGIPAIGDLVAADPKWPFGTCLEFWLEDSWKRVQVADRGGAIKGRHRFDRLVVSKREARKFGRQRVIYRRCA